MMRSTTTRQISILLTTLLAVILSSGSALSQGKNHGGDKKGGGDNRGGGRSERPQRQDREQNERPRNERPQAQREQPKGQQRNDRPQYQREEPRRQQDDRQNNGRNEQRRPDVRQAPQYRVYEQKQNGNDRGQYDGNARGQRRGNDVNLRPERQLPVQQNNAWPNNYGYYRSRAVHERNDQRKAWKNEERSLRNNGNYRPNSNVYQTDPYYGPTYSNNYNNGQDAYQYPQHQRVTFLRSLISSVLSSNGGNSSSYYPQYQSGNYYDPNYGANYNNHGGSYYSGYPQYRTFANTPYYAYQPNGYNYGTNNGYDPYYADNVPQGYYPNSGAGGGFMQQIFSRLLTQGYDEGYNAGLNARYAGYGDRYYSNPYSYEDTSYIPYSDSLGQNRRCLSDGYGLGYDDALYNEPGAVQYQDNNVDLVSVLLGMVFQS